MGSAASRPATPVPTYTAAPVKYDEKRAAVSQVQVYRQVEDDRSASGTTEMGLTRSKLDAWQQDFDATPTLKLSQLILTNADPKTSLISRERIIQDQPVFNLELKGVPDKDGKNRKGVYPGPVTNQKNSGRCWLFATTNCLRYRVIPQLNLGDFQLSQSYLFFYDKLEKANWFLENVLDLVDEPIDSRIMEFLNRDPVGDGGQFDMAVNIVEKYGVVPQAVYPESFTSSQSGPINQIVTSKLREFGLELRQIVDSLRSSSASVSKERATERARTRKDEMMRTIFDVLSCSMGTPPKPDAEFFWETYDRDGKYLKVEMTPKAFYKKYTGPYRPNECFSLINDPRNEYEKLYTVDRLGNVSGGMSVRYVNAPTSALEKAVIACIKADQPVFFGSDAGAPGIRADGIWDTKAFDYQKAYGFSLGMNKAQRLQTGDSLANHAMVITAVHLDDNGTPVRYKIENSWSDAVGNKGFFMCTADWFREYVYQVVIPEKLAESKWVEILKKGDPVVLKPWDPMGALA